jgi:small ligand-binding sensory domain FIST
MDRFAIGHAKGSNWRETLTACLAQIGDVPPGANLGLLYLADAYGADARACVDILRERTGVPHWVGSVGLGVIATGTEYYEDAAMAIMVGAFPEESFRVFGGGTRDIEALKQTHGEWYRQDDFHFGIVHGDPRNMATPELVDQLAQEVPGGFFVGGISSSNTEYVQIADGVTSGAISGVLFAPGVPVVTGLTQGCSPISETFEITESVKNVIVTIDGRPALEVMKESIGEVLARDLNRAAGYIFAGLPVEGSDTGDYLVRNLIGVDPQNQLIAIGDLAETGRRIMFCRRDGDTARYDLMRMLRDVKTRAGDRRPRGAVYYSCLGRGRNMFGTDGAELEMVREVIGDVPLVGFFANGEISYNRLYGYTGVLTLFL